MVKFFTKSVCKGRKRVKYDLVQKCLDQIVSDVKRGDVTVLEELLLLTPDYFLVGGFIDEEEWDEWKDVYDLHGVGYPKDCPKADWTIPKGY